MGSGNVRFVSKDKQSCKISIFCTEENVKARFYPEKRNDHPISPEGAIVSICKTPSPPLAADIIINM